MAEMTPEGHKIGETLGGYLTKGQVMFIDEQIRDAIQAEREACAKVAEMWDGPTKFSRSGTCALIASRIRARSEQDPA